VETGRSQAAELLEVLAQSRRTVFTTHITPDGDGLGAALALLRALRGRGQRAEFINCSAAPHNLRFLWQRGEFHVFDPDLHARLLMDADTIVATDLGGARRLGRMEEVVRSSPAKKLLIDHHRYKNDLFDLALIVEGASSSCEIVWDLLRSMGVEMTHELAEPLYVGVVNDTGSFQYDATTPRVHRMVASLLELGVEPARIFRELHCTQPLGKLQVLGSSLAAIKLACDGQLALSSTDRSTLRRLGIVPRDAFEVVNYLLRIRGVEVGVFLFPVDDSRTKVSLRSAGRVDVCSFAESHGGGGHRFAAGCTVEGMSFEQAEAHVLGAMRELLGQFEIGEA